MNYENDEALQRLQDDLLAFVAADKYFIDIPVLDERKENLVSEIANALGLVTEKVDGKIGTCVIIMSPVGNDNLPNADQGPMEMLISIRVLEDVLINSGEGGIGKPSLKTARRLARIVKHFTCAGLFNAIVPVSPTLVPVEDEIAPLAYEVRFKTTELNQRIQNRLPMPKIIPEETNTPCVVAMEPGSAVPVEIWYSTDGSFPVPNGATSTKYESEFVAEEGMEEIRAAAYTPDDDEYISSSPARVMLIAGGGTGGQFDPDSIPGLRLWLEADAIEGVANGGDVATWPDQSSFATDAVQASAPARPSFIESGINGQPCVRFDGVDDSIGGVGVFSGTEFTLFAVAKLASNGYNYNQLLALATAGSPSYISPGWVAMLRFNSILGSATPDTSQFPGGAYSFGNVALLTVVKTSSTLMARVNGASETVNATGNINATRFRIGDDFAGGGVMQGDVSVIGVYNGVLTPTEIETIEAYLTEKYIP